MRRLTTKSRAALAAFGIGMCVWLAGGLIVSAMIRNSPPRDRPALANTGLFYLYIALCTTIIVSYILLVPKPKPPGHCSTCGYNLTGNTSGRCPECGAACEPNEPPQ